MIKYLLLAALVCCICSCQKEINTDSPGQEPANNCRVIEVSDLKGPSQLGKFEYDDKKRLIAMIQSTGDTDRIHYYADSIVHDIYETYDPGGGLQTFQFKDKYMLNAKGLAGYRLTTFENAGGYLEDSVVFSYDANNYLIGRTSYTSWSTSSMQFSYNNGNVAKVTVTGRTDPSIYNSLDSMVIKYSGISVPASYSLNEFWDYDTDPLQQFPWAGTQNKELPTQIISYYSWGVITYDYTLIAGADGRSLDIKVHIKQVSYQRPGKIDEWDDANHLKYTCD